jgi:hypothetical protein
LNLSHPPAVLFLAVAGGLLAVTGAAFLRSRAPVQIAGERRKSTGWTTALVVLVIVVWSTGATAGRGRWTRGEYFIAADQASREAAGAMVALDRCRVCFASSRSQVDWTWLEPNPGGAPAVDIGTQGRTVTIDIAFGSDGDTSGFGRVQVDFGDGVVAPWTGVVGRWTITHEYPRAGEYRVVVWQQLRSGPRVDRRTITVGGGD